MVGVTGIEPVTPSMSTKCSPAELYARNRRLRARSVGSPIEGRAARFKTFCPAPRAHYSRRGHGQGDAMADSVFALRMPAERRSCAVFSSPHSGADYPAAFLGRPAARRRCSSAPPRTPSSTSCSPPRPPAGAPLLAARVPRACIDLNRAPDDLDPALIAGASRRFLNPRIAAGLGVIPRVVGEGRPIIHGKLPLAEAQRRIARLLASLPRAAARAARPRRGRRSAWRSSSTATRCRTTR